MPFINEYEIDKALNTFTHDEPNLYRAATLLSNLRDWVNSCSDGWPYWIKPRRAANKLIGLVISADPFDPQDVTDAELKAALTPVKSFLTRHGTLPSTLGF